MKSQAEPSLRLVQDAFHVMAEWVMFDNDSPYRMSDDLLLPPTVIRAHNKTAHAKEI